MHKNYKKMINYISVFRKKNYNMCEIYQAKIYNDS